GHPQVQPGAQLARRVNGDPFEVTAAVVFLRLEEKATGTHRRSMLGGTQKGRTGKQGDAGQKRVSFDAIHEQWFSTQDGAYFHGHGIASSHELTQGKCMANLGPEAFRGYRRGDRLNGVQRSRGEVFGNT